MSHYESSSSKASDWTELFSNTHKRAYWFNNSNGATSWEKPEGFINTPTAAPSSSSSPFSSSSSSAPSTKRARTETDGTTDDQANTKYHAAQQLADRSHVATLAPGVRVDSYQPPVSGSAEDEARIISRTLRPPRIEENLAPSKEDMWTRKDIQVNKVLVGFLMHPHHTASITL
jgi:hypothetical protein